MLQYCNLRKTRPSSTKKALTMCLWRASGLRSTNLPLLAGRSSHIRWPKTSGHPPRSKNSIHCLILGSCFSLGRWKNHHQNIGQKHPKLRCFRSDQIIDLIAQSNRPNYGIPLLMQLVFEKVPLLPPAVGSNLVAIRRKTSVTQSDAATKNKVVWRPPRSITSSTCSLLASLSGLRHWYLMFFFSILRLWINETCLEVETEVC